jgi:hypothetical protein
MTNSANKWPVNATLLSAVIISAPVITSITNIGNEVTLTWTQNETCLPATEFTIYENDIPVKIVSGTIFTTNIVVDNPATYTFYIVATNSTIISEPSNSLTVTVYYN